MKNNINSEPLFQPCTSCQMCAAVCPMEAISIVEDKEGFYRPIVDEEKCVGCGACRKYCYRCKQFSQAAEPEKVKAMAAQAKDKELLQESTSGGIAGLLAEYLFVQGYHVVGVGYDYKRDRAVTEIADKEEALLKFRGSKYMQSYTVETLKKLIKGNKERYAVFGTPCQIYALGEWTKNTGNRERFFLVDIFCHGCSSLLLWDKYIQLYKDKIQANEFDRIEFRSKVYGWHEYAHTFQKKGERLVSKQTIDDPFFVFFFDNYILNEACYECKVRSRLMYADIRLGDFWGHRYDTNTKGVSAVVICSERAEEMIEGIQKQIHYTRDIPFAEVVKAQSYGKDYILNTEMRERAFVCIKESDSIEDAFKKYLRQYSGKQKIKRVLKKAVYCLPRSMQMKIKKLYHTR